MGSSKMSEIWPLDVKDGLSAVEREKARTYWEIVARAPPGARGPGRLRRTRGRAPGGRRRDPAATAL